MSAMSVSNQCDLNYKMSKNQRLLVELCLIKLSHISEVLQIDKPESPPTDDLKKKALTP